MDTWKPIVGKKKDLLPKEHSLSQRKMGGEFSQKTGMNDECANSDTLSNVISSLPSKSNLGWRSMSMRGLCFMLVSLRKGKRWGCSLLQKFLRTLLPRQVALLNEGIHREIFRFPSSHVALLLCEVTRNAITGNEFYWWSQNTDRER